jgi:FixJ family two-component response regulator
MSKQKDWVVVVDHDVDELATIARFLSSHGYRVRMFESAERYLESPDAGESSCVVIDVHIGSAMAGLDLGRSISGCGTTIIFMTRSADEATRQEATAMGAALIEKRFLGEHLITAVGGTRSQRS